METISLDIKKKYYVEFSYKPNKEVGSVIMPYRHISNHISFDTPYFDTMDQAINNIAVDAAYDGLVYLSVASPSEVECRLYEDSYIDLPKTDGKNHGMQDSVGFKYLPTSHIITRNIIRQGPEFVAEIGAMESVKSVYNDICYKMEMERTKEKREKESEERTRNENFYNQWKKLEFMRKSGKFDEFIEAENKEPVE